MAQIFRDSWEEVPKFLARNKVIMGMVNNGSLAFIVFQVQREPPPMNLCLVAFARSRKAPALYA